MRWETSPACADTGALGAPGRQGDLLGYGLLLGQPPGRANRAEGATQALLILWEGGTMEQGLAWRH